MSETATEQARQALANGNALTCIDICSTALDSDDTNSTLYAIRAEAQLSMRNTTDALMDCQSALQAEHPDPQAYYIQGRVLVEMNEFDKALASLKKFKELAPTAPVAEEADALIEKCTAAGAGASTDEAASAVSQAVPPQAQKQQNVKQDWYQSDSLTTLTLMIKKVDPERASITFTPSTCHVKIDLPTGGTFEKQYILFDEIDPDASTFKVLGTKVEIRLKKRSPVRWPRLEGNGKADSVVYQMATVEEASKAQPHDSKWDKVAASVEEEQPEGEQALNHLLKQIYGDGSEETRRAMMKSYYESGGTVLSTNWDEVGKEKVEVKPPEGTEFKKW